MILPTASAPDGEATFRTWAEMGTEHFAALGAEVEPVLVRDVAGGHDAAALQAVGEADLVYLSGGHPAHLLRVLHGSPLGARARGGQRARRRDRRVLGGGDGDRGPDRWTSGSLPKLRIPLPFPIRWPVGLALVDGIAVLPHYDAWPEPFSALVALQAPRGGVVLGHRRGHGGRRAQRRLAGARPRPRDASGAGATASGSARATRSGSEAVAAALAAGSQATGGFSPA